MGHKYVEPLSVSNIIRIYCSWLGCWGSWGCAVRHTVLDAVRTNRSCFSPVFTWKSGNGQNKGFHWSNIHFLRCKSADIEVHLDIFFPRMNVPHKRINLWEPIRYIFIHFHIGKSVLGAKWLLFNLSLNHIDLPDCQLLATFALCTICFFFHLLF